MHTPGIFGDVAADCARDLRRRIGRIEQAMRRRSLGDRQIAHTRLDGRRARKRVDRQDAHELGERQDDAVAVGKRPARQAGAGAARDDRQPRGMAELQDRDDLRFAFRQQNRVRLLAEQRQPVAFVGPRVFGRRENRGRGKNVAESGEQGGIEHEPPKSVRFDYSTKTRLTIRRACRWQG